MMIKNCSSTSMNGLKSITNKGRGQKYSSTSFSSFNSSGCSCCGQLFCMASSPSSSQLSIQKPVLIKATSYSTSSVPSSPSLASSSQLSTSPRQLLNGVPHRGFSDKTQGIDDSHIDELLKNNKKWVASMKEKDANFFHKLGQKQTPKFLYFGCSDSRVPANEILGLGPGQVFIHRNVGNLAPGNDLNSLSVLEYAVAHLNVTDIMVTGHYDCGAVRAAVSRQDLGTLENWLRLIRDVYRLHKDQLDHIYDDEEKHQRLVELNVIEQGLNLYKTGVVQRKRKQTFQQSGGKEMYPRIHAMVFNPSEGVLKKLSVDFDRRVGNLDHIYGLYDNRN